MPAKMFDTLCLPAKRRLKAHAVHGENRVIGADFRILRANIGLSREPVSHAAAAVTSRKLHNALVVRIQNGHALRRQPLNQLALGGGHAVDRIEIFHMRIADVRDHTMLRFRNGDKLANFARMIHAHFEHGNLRPRPATAKWQAAVLYGCCNCLSFLPTLKRTLSNAAITSLVLVFPALPVTATIWRFPSAAAPSALKIAAQAKYR